MGQQSPKQGDTAAAMRAVTDRQKKNPTVAMRATQTGYYGRPISDLVKPGTVFQMALADLLEFKGQPNREKIAVNGKAYLLPLWCEDGRREPMAAADEPNADDAASLNDDVI